VHPFFFSINTFFVTLRIILAAGRLHACAASYFWNKEAPQR